eukprot:2303858-Prymnesium_polylepis.1
MPSEEKPQKRPRIDAGTTTTVCLPQILRTGGGCSLTLPEVVRSLGMTNPMLVTDDFIVKSGMLAPIESALVEAGFDQPLVFSGVVPDPTTDSIAKGFVLWEASGTGAAARCDCIVGVGGG